MSPAHVVRGREGFGKNDHEFCASGDIEPYEWPLRYLCGWTYKLIE